MVAAFVMILFLRPWIQGVLSGAHVSLVTILGMHLRGTPVAKVIRALVAARQSGLELSCQEVERASLRSVDPMEAVLAWVEARKKDPDTSFETVVEALLSRKLQAMAGGPTRTIR